MPARRLAGIFILAIPPERRLPEGCPTLMKKIFALVSLFCITCSAMALAADEPAPGRIPTVTRLVKIFAGLEEELAEKVRAGNADAVEKMLLADFELRAGPTPGEPTPKA